MRKKAITQCPVRLTIEDGHYDVTIKVPVSFRLPETPSNRKFIVVFLRLLVLLTGERLVTHQQVADLMKYPDRRNVHNFWSEFQQHNYDLLAYLSRKVDLKDWVPIIESLILKNLSTPLSQIYNMFVAEHQNKMCYASFLKYAAQINPLRLLRKMQPQPANKECGNDALKILRMLADQHNTPVICDQLLEQMEKGRKKNVPQDNKLPISLERKNLCLLVTYLVGCGLSLKNIAFLFNVSKSTVSNLWHEITDLQSLILNSIAKWSGKISIDEKYININGKAHYVISIVDFVTHLPLYLDVFPDTKKASYEACFRAFKLIYKKPPRLIVSDGSKALAAARMAVFPLVPFQLCKFHKLRNLIKRIYQSCTDEQEKTQLKNKAVAALRRKTVSGRKKGLVDLLCIAPPSAAIYIRDNILEIWRHLSKG
ncbi:MAG: hypothetical protein JW704_01215, partial [Anaerolineaceae bacterium]|nr:hypothetical protein [Anaerolineaceae bacterium]